MKKLCSVLMIAVLSVSLLTGCGDQSTKDKQTDVQVNAEGESYKVGIIQLTEHAALDATNTGFCDAIKASGLNVVIEQQNAQNDQPACTTIANKLVSDQNDLILAIATPAAQAVAAVTEDIPIVATAITDFVDAGLIESDKAPNTNVTGTSDLTPVKEQIELLTQILPDVKKIGILYCSAEDNSRIQADLAKAECDKLGIEYEVFTVSSSNEIQTVVESMVGKVEAIYAPTDNMIAAGMSTVGMVALDNNLPVICGEGGMVKEGGLATYGIDYYQLGYMAGEIAVSILKGEAEPATTPIGYLDASKCELTINEENAEALNIVIPELNK